MPIPALVLEWLEGRILACEKQRQFNREADPKDRCEDLMGREVAYRDVLEKLKGLDS